MCSFFLYIYIIQKKCKVIDLPKVIRVDKDKCVNCHACISACPVKYCNDGSGDYVTVNTNNCIACGNCLQACTHDARMYIDDFELFIDDLKINIPIIAIVAPSVASNFRDKYLNLNGWLKSIGIEAVFDVSFGAELTVKSYLEYIKKHNPKTIIAQPCAALVSYIEIYKPELLKYLIPVDSPMVHTMKYIEKKFPEYSNHKVAVISPCNAKKREYEETGYGDYNIAYKSLFNYFANENIDLLKYPRKDYNNPQAERAVMFSSPGGLIETIERWMPEMRQNTRKIEGLALIYEYFEHLPSIIEDGKSPLLIDCLSCNYGCNSGPLTLNQDTHPDEIEYWINKRVKELKQYYNDNESLKPINEIIEENWIPNLFNRKYNDLSENFILKIPSAKELNLIYEKMYKFTDDDLYNCTACGYYNCEKMAIAIFNGLNRAENCHFYLNAEMQHSKEKTEESRKKLKTILSTSEEGFVEVDNDERIIDYNDSLKKILKCNDLKDKFLYDFLDDKNKDTLLTESLKRSKESGSYELTFTDCDKNYVNCLVSATPLFDDNNKKLGSFAMITDITELKKVTNELFEINEQLENRVKERTMELDEKVEELEVTSKIINEINEEINLQKKKIEKKNHALESQKQEILEKNEELLQQKEEILATNEMLETKQQKIISINENLSKQQTELNKKNNILRKQKIDILKINLKLERQKDEIEKKNIQLESHQKQITDSILYAKRIQTALLPFNRFLDDVLKEYFILYKPRDIVSGDFFWAKVIENQLIIAAVDCTGHGVPGAFMSILGYAYINEAVTKLALRDNKLKASLILDELRLKVLEALSNHTYQGVRKDGMDLSLCILDIEHGSMQYSGAYNPIYLIRNNELQVLKTDKMPIGISTLNDRPFTNYEIKILPEDRIYLLSDGYQDQFGGPKNRKFLVKNFKKLILTIHDNPMYEQKLILESIIERWKGENEQTDDMLLLGIKI